MYVSFDGGEKYVSNGEVKVSVSVESTDTGTFTTSCVEAVDGGGKQRSSCIAYDSTGVVHLRASCIARRHGSVDVVL